MDKTCKKCKWGFMMPSVTWLFWYKCPCCGYHEFNLDWIHPTNHKTAKVNPLTLTLSEQLKRKTNSSS